MLQKNRYYTETTAIYTHTHTHTHIYIYIYIYIEREDIDGNIHKYDVYYDYPIFVYLYMTAKQEKCHLTAKC